MTTQVTIQLLSVCAGQGHVRVRVTENEGASKDFTYEVTELREPLDWNDAERIARDLLRMHFRGMTNQQARAALQAGIAVEV